jgi:hypothetical protein
MKKAFEKNIIKLGLIIAALFFAFMWIDSCQGRKNDQSIAEQNEAAYKDTVRNIKNDLGGVTATKLAFQKTNADLQKELSQWKKTGTQDQKELAVLINKFNTLVAVGSIDAEVRIDTIEFKYPEPIPCDFKPFSVRDSTEYWDIALFVKRNKAFAYDLSVPTTQHTVFGYKGNGLFKKDVATMETTFTNPNISVTKATGTIVIVDKPWYEKWWVWFVTGIAAGSMTAFSL